MYGIFKTDVREYDFWEDCFVSQPKELGYKIDEVSDWNFAVEMAQAYAEDHAKRIDVEWHESGNFSKVTGGTFVTNNGTRVWYTAKELK